MIYHSGSKAVTPDRSSCDGNNFTGAGSPDSHTTMIHDSAPLRVFRVSELTRIIASQLVLTSQESAVNLACTCRCLEGPALSALWEIQASLHTLLKVLPKANWHIEGAIGSHTVRDWISRWRDRTLKHGHLSSGSWRIHHQRLGAESSATLLGCARPA